MMTSTDDTAAVVETFTELDPRFRLLRKENGGAVSAHNLGLGSMRGVYRHGVQGAAWAEVAGCGAGKALVMSARVV